MPKVLLSIDQVRELLPHRYPMLFVDRVIELGEDSIVAEKMVSSNEPYFQGHFPQRPIMPGVLILEALAQAGGLIVRHNDEEARRRGGNLLVIEGSARVEGEIAAEAEIWCAIVDWEASGG